MIKPKNKDTKYKHCALYRSKLNEKFADRHADVHLVGLGHDFMQEFSLDSNYITILFQNFYEAGEKKRAIETMTNAFRDHPEQITSEGNMLNNDVR